MVTVQPFLAVLDRAVKNSTPVEIGILIV